MGNRFEISVVHEDEQWAEACIDDAVAEISRIEQLFTTFQGKQPNQPDKCAGGHKTRGR